MSEDVDFAHHLMALCPPPTLPPYRSASGIDYASKKYLKWQAIQLHIVIQYTADTVNCLE